MTQVHEHLAEHGVRTEPEPVEAFLAHHGVKGMKWGVRKDRKGKIRPRASMDRRDRKDSKWANNAQTSVYDRVYKKAARKIRGSVRILNRNPKFKGVDFRKDSPLRREYYKEYEKLLVEQLNAASDLKGLSPNKRLRLEFSYDINKDMRPVATVVRADTRSGRRQARSQARETRRLNHSAMDTDENMTADEPAFKIRSTFDEQGHVSDFEILPLDDVEHSSASVDEFLAHYGVVGMKWGIRKDRSGKARPTKQVLAEKKRRRQEASQARADARKEKRLGRGTSKTLKRSRSQNGNDRAFLNLSEMSNDEINAIVKRLELEQRLSSLTATQKAPPSRVRRLLADVSYDVSKGALTEVGKLALATALKQLYKNSTGIDLKTPKK